MRFFSLFLSVLLLSAVMSAQKRYLVSPNDEVIPVDPEKGALASMKEWKQRMVSSRNGVCSNKFQFGYDIVNFPTDNNFGGYHRDVFGQWFTAKATGTIDTLFWQQWNAVNAYDSTIFVRIHNSYIGPDYGPGIRPGPFNPPCQNWGYWASTADLDQGVAAFIEEASDTTWVSTINFSAVPSGPPFGLEIWGYGGYPVTMHAAQVNSLNLAILGVPSVTIGDHFFVSQRIAFNPSLPFGGHEEQSDEGRTEIGAIDFLVTTNDEDYPARNWKFYEHDKGPSNCGGTIPIDSIKRGWVARGGFTTDTLNTAVWNWWYAMTVSSNVPPIVVDQDQTGYSFDPGAKTLTATIEDCNPANPGNAGVASAFIRYAVDNGPPIDVAMDPLGSDVFQGEIPAVPVGSSVTWKVFATDLDGATGQGPPDSYKIVPFGTDWFSIDTGYVCVPVDISGSGTPVDTAAFFNPYYTGSGTAPKDDGTAGPYDMGDNYVVFGDEFRYAWIGVNGAIALSKTALDTLDVNSNGFATAGWDLPLAQHHGRSDTNGTTLPPPMFIAPMWADHIIGDSAGQYGRILRGNAGDTCRFIVQWDSIGAFATAGPIVDITTFRVILNRCTGVVEYQYESVGTTGLDSAALIGAQADSSALSGPDPGYVFVNRNGYPLETRPYDGYCVRMYPKIATVVNDGWNIVAVSLTPNDANYAKTALFPTAASNAFAYNGGYVTAPTMSKGAGYWMKFNGGGGVGASPATFDNDITATVADKWNLVGGPSGYVATGSIGATGGTVASSYYGYSGAYYTALVIQPGQGYWVKMNGAGTLTMNSWAAAPKAVPMVVGETDLTQLNKVTITDAAGRSQSLYIGNDGQIGNELSFYELPPVPPAGLYDVRFASQRMVESYPDVQAEARTLEFPIAIQGAVYPVVVSWEMNSPVKGSRKMIFTDFVNSKAAWQVMEGTGYLMIKSENVKNLGIRISEGVNVPATFAMSQNYPNPFNPVTHFTVDLPKSTEVEVAVYDLLGRKIASLLSGNQAAGQYTLEWDGRDANGVGVPTGMYFLRLSSDEFNATQKVMLMK